MNPSRTHVCTGGVHVRRPVNVGYLARILRLLACEGVVTEKKRGGEDGTNVGFYGLTDVGKLFQVRTSYIYSIKTWCSR